MLQVYGGYLHKLVTLAPRMPQSSGTEPSAPDLVGTAVEELAELAYANMRDGIADSGQTKKTREFLRNRLELAFARLIRAPEDARYVCGAILKVKPDAVPTDPVVGKSRDEGLLRLRKLVEDEKTGPPEKSGLLKGLALLHAICISQLYAQDPDAFDVLADLERCYSKICEEDNSEDASSSLVEILLSQVARPSSLMRQMSLKVFEAFTGYMKPQALELLTGPLMAEENTKGQRELFTT